ncbi:uncharacterized protein EKO05_0003598 [Ascochyta rabiei]|uniref:Uncharacterized protein n=1 Tax=Didymella rabiei TaxID=5454 RepID=A0A163LVQ3_DIDRA|nr:uncharacterized protein EKO05_0003598 [Ascochyta rabiei]KZM28165.1 hypothetical protein ST47_g688 [Ascochyta rabiei]UPX13070.1 hypothetical protein EKO05_0003598 [Ascochyta rabiei]
MPTRPARRERRRAERRNANQAFSPILRMPLPPQGATTALVDRTFLTIFMSADPIVRTVMRLLLIQTSFAHSQVLGFEIWKEALRQEKPRRSAPNYAQHEYQILCFEAITELHYTHIHVLAALELDYARQVIMWGLECSKAEAEWDMHFIARRRLELAQLNRLTSKLALAFEEELQGLLGNENLFSLQTEGAILLGALEKFRDNFAHGLVVADEETLADLEVAGL